MNDATWTKLNDKTSYRTIGEGEYLVSLLDSEEDPADHAAVADLLTQEVGAAVERVTEWSAASVEPDVTATYRRI